MPKRKILLTGEQLEELKEFLEITDQALESKRAQAILMLDTN